MKNNKGFSLVELIVVIAIMAILAAVAIPTFATFITKANVASDVSFVNDAEYAAELAAAGKAKEVNEVYVNVDNKTPKYIVIIVENGTTDVEVTVTSAGVVTHNDSNTNANYDWAKDAVATLDWTYSFKSEKSGTFNVVNNKLAPKS